MGKLKMGFLLLGFTGACVSTQMPRNQLAQSKAAIRAAEELNAEQQPAARLHLKLARDAVREAEQFINDGDNGRAAATLERASLDAELALALAKAQQTRSEAAEAMQRVEQLRQQSVQQ